MGSSSATLSSALLLLFFPLLSHAATFTVVNQCSYTVWAAAAPGGGQQLNSGRTWTFTANPGTQRARVWGRTGCNFDGSGHGRCQTGDCGGVLRCTGYGSAPNTLAEYALNQYANQDYYDISIIEGFNIPMDFTPTSGGCRDLRCTANNDCRDAYCNSNDKKTFSCATGTNYKVTFCP